MIMEVLLFYVKGGNKNTYFYLPEGTQEGYQETKEWRPAEVREGGWMGQG